MLDALFRRLALEMLGASLRNPDLAEAYWDLMYFYRFGLPKIPGVMDLPRPFPPPPQPDPSPLDQIRLHEGVLFDVVNAFLNDPDPEPNINSVLRNPVARLKGARSLAKRLAVAQKGLGKEIERLERLVKA